MSPSSAVQTISHGLGLALAVVGLAEANGLFDVMVTRTLLPSGLVLLFLLTMALASSCLHLHEHQKRLGGSTSILAATCLAGGLVAIGYQVFWQQGQAHWTALVGCAAMLMVTWRLWGAPLAVTGLAALLYAATWRHGFDLPTTGVFDFVRHAGTNLWLGLDLSRLGWVLDILLSKALILFLVGSVLASRVFPTGSTDNMSAIDITGASRLAAAIHATCQFFLPTLVLGMIFMTVRPGLALPLVATATILPFALSVVWFWIRPTGMGNIMLPSGLRWQHAALVGGTAITLISALVGGMSLQGSSSVALCTAIVLSFVDAGVRSSPRLMLEPIARGAAAFSRLLIAAGVIGIVLAVLARSGLPLDIAQILAAITGEARLPVQLLTVLIAIGLGMVMPGLAAYLIATALLGVSLRTVGAADITSHLMILLACAGASAIVAARAAAEESMITSSCSGKIKQGASIGVPVEHPQPHQA